MYRYCSRAPKAIGLICRQRQPGGEVRGGHPAQAPCCPSAPLGGTHQWMPQDHDVLALPFGVQHVGKVGTAHTQDTAMCPEGLPVHHKNHIAMDALLQKPGEG